MLQPFTYFRDYYPVTLLTNIQANRTEKHDFLGRGSNCVILNRIPIGYELFHSVSIFAPGKIPFERTFGFSSSSWLAYSLNV